MWLKICGSHLTCKIANKCVNVREMLKVVEWNKRWTRPFPYCPVNRQCPWKETLIEKKWFYRHGAKDEGKRVKIDLPILKCFYGYYVVKLCCCYYYCQYCFVLFFVWRVWLLNERDKKNQLLTFFSIWLMLHTFSCWDYISVTAKQFQVFRNILAKTLTQTYKMKVFVKVVNNWMRLTIFARRSIFDVWLDSKNASEWKNKVI